MIFNLSLSLQTSFLLNSDFPAYCLSTASLEMTVNIWKSYMCTAVKKWDISDPCSYEHYWTSSWNETWKKEGSYGIWTHDRDTGAALYQMS